MASTLIIYAHPGRKGHNGCVLRNVERGLKGEDYELIDLYKDDFNPVLPANEHVSEGRPSLSSDAKRYQEKVKRAERLIFIYPVWWGSMPAILKGFFDRVFTAHFAFKYNKLPFPIFGLKARPIGLLKDKRALVIMTTGSVRWVQLLVMRNVYRFLAKKAILSFSGIKTVVSTIDGCGDPLCKDKEEEIKKKVGRALRRFR